MKMYYLYQGDQRQGPYTIDQLKQMQISPSVPAWTEGMTTWTQAQNIPELQAALFSTPPPFVPAYSAGEHQMSTTERVGFTMGRNWVKALGAVVVLAALFFIIRVAATPGNNANNDERATTSDVKGASYTPEPPRPKTQAELKAELRQTEIQHPVSYISTKFSWWKNLVGETVIEGTLTNNATMAPFKDPVLRVTWLSKTNTPMRVSSYPVYEYLGPRQSVPYKLKVHGPRKAESINLAIESASVVE